MARLVATCVWTVSDDLIAALDDRFGPPVDSYVNGAQVWLRDDGPGGIALEWRLHPVAGYERPAGTDTYDVFELTATALATGGEPPALPAHLWEGLEAYSAYGEEVEPATLAGACTAALGTPPDAAGLVDHGRIGDEWERSAGATSIIAGLLSELRAGRPSD